VHRPPAVKGGLALRTAALVTGLALCGVGILLMVEAHLGLPPWDVLQQGLSRHTPLTFGLANVVVGIVVLAVSWRLGAPIGPGTIANAVLIGLFVELLASVDAFDGLGGSSIPTRIGVLVLALAAFGLGSALYIGASMGAGPRDSLMLVLAARTGRRISVVRAGIEVGATAAGFALGGTVGVGTVVFAGAIGPVVELGFVALVALGAALPARAPVPVAATIDAR